MNKSKKQLASAAVLVLLCAGCAAAAVAFRHEIWALITSQTARDEFVEWVRSHGVWGMLVFLALEVFQIVVAVVPGEPVQIMAGALYGLNFSTVAASKFKFDTSILVLVFVVLGGIGSIRGSIIAATLLTILPEVLRAFSDYRMLVYAVVLILVMLATNSPFLSVRLQRLKALVRREKTNPGKEGEAA